jgi:hypothetical protein
VQAAYARANQQALDLLAGTELEEEDKSYYRSLLGEPVLWQSV